MVQQPTYSKFYTVYYSDIPGVSEVIGNIYHNLEEARMNAGASCYRIEEDIFCSYSKEHVATIYHDSIAQ